MSLPLTTLIEMGGLRFLITDKPTTANVPLCVDVFKKTGVTALVRVCEEDDYDTQPVVDAGVSCHALAFDDGSPPPQEIIDSWLEIVSRVFSKSKKKKKSKSKKKSKKAAGGGGGGGGGGAAAAGGGGSGGGGDAPCIAIHCVAGLGRAPLMVTIALVHAGINYTKAVEAIRDKRPGCINSRQLRFLQQFKKNKKYKFGDAEKEDCVIL